ncbi:MAG: pyridoxal-phosphate dependent enzyme [Bdellovibrionales bacterium]|nr:pyridoxal-phosphate dependent enzyme [Bdellovibrionales bacterium]
MKIQTCFQDIQLAKKRLSPYIKKTRLSSYNYGSRQLGLSLFLKWESEQKTKSFKIRGALNKILSLTKEEKARGLIAASAGNHAQGVALAAQLFNIKFRVVMMETASKVKILETKKLGAEIILKGKTYDESYEYALSIGGDSIFIHPFADTHVIAGQGTIGLELFEELPDLDSVVIPVGGGGLLSGVSLALKHLKPSLKIYGVTWEGTPDFCKKFNKIREGQNCLCEKNLFMRSSKSGLTDGIAVKKSSPEILDFCFQYVDGICCVSEKEISEAIVEIKEQTGQKVEGSGATALVGALKYQKDWDLGKTCCVLISGANIDEDVFLSLL